MIRKVFREVCPPPPPSTTGVYSLLQVLSHQLSTLAEFHTGFFLLGEGELLQNSKCPSGDLGVCTPIPIFANNYPEIEFGRCWQLC